MKRQNRKSNSKNRRASGFTLMEAVYAIMIIGLGVVSLMQVLAAGTNVNGYGNNLSSGVFLANEIHAMTDDSSFDGLIAQGNLNFAQAVDANGNVLTGLASFSQQLQVTPINPVDMTTYVGPDPEMLRLTAIVTKQGNEIIRNSWLRYQ